MLSLNEIRRSIHRRPELAFTEIETAALVVDQLRDVADVLRWGAEVCDTSSVAGLPDDDDLAAARERARSAGTDPRLVDDLGHGATGVVATVRGQAPGPATGIRVDLDALAVDEASGAEHLPAREGFASERPGVMHACGHDGHVAIGIDLVRRLARDRSFAGEVSVLFQPAEEGVRGAATMVAAGAAAGLDRLIGLHLGIDLPRGTVAAAARGVMATEKWRCTFTGRPAHAALAPHEGRNALLAASAAALALHGLPPHPTATTRVNVGRLDAGTATNVVPHHAELWCEVRADRDDALAGLVERGRSVMQGAAQMHEVSCEVVVTGASRTARCDDAVVDLLERVARDLPSVGRVLRSAPMTASDDVTIWMDEVQRAGGSATFALVGCSSPAPHHHPRFDLDEDALVIAGDWLEAVVRQRSTADGGRAA